jgi:DNA gyrase subunit A
VIVSQDGWVKRQKEVRDVSATRLREGDAVLAALSGSTRAAVAFFTNFGVAYTCRLVDVPASTGYGEPIQRLFKFRDGERVIAAFSLDPRHVGDVTPPARDAAAGARPGRDERRLLAPVRPRGLLEPSTRAGRRFARPAEGREVVGVALVSGTETIIAVTAQARAMLCPSSEVNYLSGPGKGVILIKIDPNAIACSGSSPRAGDRDLLVVETSRGAQQTVSTAKYEVTSRGGRGRER